MSIVKNKIKYIGITKSQYQLFNSLCYLIDKPNLAGNAKIYYESYFHKAKPISNTLLMLANEIGVEIVFTSRFKIEKGSVLIACNIPVRFSSLQSLLFGNVSFVKIDDGIGSYQGFKSIYLAAKRELKGSPLKIILFPIKFYVGNFLEFLLLKDYQSCWVNNERYKHSLNQLGQMILNVSKRKMTFSKPIAIFCTQPFIELGVVSLYEQEMILNKARSVAEGRGLNFKVLKHPADVLYEYSSEEICVFDGIFEEFMSFYKDDVKLVLSINSSCIISAYKLYGIDCVSVKTTNIVLIEERFESTIKELFNSSCVENYIV